MTGNTEIQGHWSDNGDYDYYRQPREGYLNPFWKKHIEEFFNLIPIRWILKPSAVIFNVGIHVKREERWQNEDYAKKVVNASQALAPIFIYRTTTYGVNDLNETEFSYNFRDHYFCDIPSVRCMNVSWTRCIPANEFIDDFHFIIEPYNKLARQFMHFWIHGNHTLPQNTLNIDLVQ